jgi:sugar phosphate permease
MGVAQAGIFPCSTKAISRWFPAERRASATGFLGSCMSAGGAAAPVLTGLLLVVVTWRWVFLLYALPGIAWAILFYRVARDGPAAPVDGVSGQSSGVAEQTVRRPSPQPSPIRMGEGVGGEAEPVWSRLLTSGSMWLLCSQQFLRAAAMIFFATWFPTYLREARGATVVQSGFLTTLAAGGAVLGSLLGGFTSDRLLTATGSRRLSRQGIAVAGMTACAALIVGAYFVADTTLAVLVISAGAFCGAFGGVSGYTVAMDLGGRRVATVFSTMNMCGNLGAALFPLAIGWLVQRTGNWDLVLFIFAGIFALAAVCWLLLNPRGPLFAEE